MLDFDFGRMRNLDKKRVQYLIVHTQGSPTGAESSAAAIHRYHRDPRPKGRGWAGIGYHKVIRKDGTVELGRPELYQGAHADGMNDKSLGICVTGNGDIDDFTPEQHKALAQELAAWMKEYKIPIGKVIGHREINTVPGVPRTDKTCPGNKVDMNIVRYNALFERMGLPKPEPDIDPEEVPVKEPTIWPI